jgi:hypothetical protein
MYIERVASIRQQRQSDLVSKREKKEAKEQRERVKKKELTEKLQEIRGLWKTPHPLTLFLCLLLFSFRYKICLSLLTGGSHSLNIHLPLLSRVFPGIFQNLKWELYPSAEKLSANLKCVIRNGEEARPIASNEVSTTSNPISNTYNYLVVPLALLQYHNTIW